jgi:hypothetical protein
VQGSPFYPQHQIAEIVDRAVAEGDAERALQWARGLKQVTLDRALALTVVLGREGDERYLAGAHRFPVRFIVEIRPSLLNLKKGGRRPRRGRPRRLHAGAAREGAETALEGVLSAVDALALVGTLMRHAATGGDEKTRSRNPCPSHRQGG